MPLIEDFGYFLVSKLLTCFSRNSSKSSEFPIYQFMVNFENFEHIQSGTFREKTRDQFS